MKRILKFLIVVSLIAALLLSTASCANIFKDSATTDATTEATTPVENPTETTPAQTTPVEATPEETTPVEIPVETTPVETPEVTTPVETPEVTTPDETTESTPDETTESTPDETTESTPDETTESTPDETTESTPDETTESTPDETTESTPDETTESTPDETTESTPDETTESTPDETTESTPDETTPEETPDETSATITFDNKDYRTEYSESIQVWEQNGITVTNNKAKSTNAVGDYAKPARFYKSSSITIACANMTKIEINVEGLEDKYVTAWVTDFNNIDGATAVKNGGIITVTLDAPVDSITIEATSAQVRANSITVYAVAESQECQHTNTTVEGAVDATCTTEGHTGNTVCQDCGEVITAGEVIPALTHTIVIDEAVNSTCTEAGKTEGSHCSVCGEVLVAQEVVDALGHTTVVDAAVSATCTEAGKTEGSHCSVCGEVLVAQEVVDALGHTWGEWITDTEATEEADGTKHKVCSACGAIEDGIIPRPDHQHTYTTVVTEPTCTEGGFTTYTCKCGETYVGDETEARGHQENTHEAQDATCTEIGWNEYVTCSRCDYSTYEEIAALGHDEIAHEAQDTTCTEIGWNAYVTCSQCDYSTYEEIAATGHTTVVDAAVGATCTADGKTEGSHCSVCGEVFVAQEAVPALGHSGFETDYKCDTCSKIIAPAANEALTLAQANALGMAHAAKQYTADKYYVTGIITSIVNTQYGNVYITDAEGNTFYIYGLYSYDGEIRYDAMTTKPGLGDEITVWGQIGTYDGKVAQMQNGWIDEIVACPHVYEVFSTIDATCTSDGSVSYKCTVCNLNVVTENIPATGHAYDHGTCTKCGEAFKTTETIVFDFGANGSAAHVDGNAFSGTKSYTSGAYTLSLTSLNKVYGPAYDAKGNSCIKLGTSSATASFSFTVPEDVTEVIIYVAKYKSNTTKITVNGTAYTLTKNSNDGAYDAIVVDTTTTKTISFATVSGGVRAMINTIEFKVNIGSCEHVYDNDCDSACNICGETRATEHNYEAVVTAPTCTENGYTTYTCSACDDTYVADETDALGHNYEAVVTAPTCTEDGYTTYTCSVCGDTYVADETDALGHDYDAVVTAPTCTEDGYTTYTCSACGDTYVADETDALGHDYDAVVTAPTCTAGGFTTYTCSVCGHSYVADKTNATGHSYSAVVTAPTCTEDGYTTYTCSVCGDTYVADETDALGHTPGEAATCTHAQICTVCNAVLAAKLDHNYQNGYCADCGVADGHPCDYVAVVTDPTCTTAGYTTYTCSVCFDSYTEAGEAALGHTWDNACDTACNVCGTTRTIEHAYEAVVTAPTCTEDGYTTYTCSVCGNSYVADEVEATGHATEVEYWTYNNDLYLVPVCGCLSEKVLVDATNGILVENEKDLVFLLTNGFDVILGADINLTATIDIEGAIVTLDLNGKTLKADWESNGVVEVIHVHDGSHLTIVGEGNVISGGEYIAETNSVISCRVYSQLTIKGGNYYSASCGDVIFCETNSTVYIEGGHFEAAEDYYGTWYVLDIDESETTNRGQFIVTGGTFVNFDPANHTCDADYTNKVADGYHSIQNENTYTVGAHAYNAVVTAPTCTTAGFTTYTCVCGDTYTADPVEATGHNHEAVVTAPTCEEAGYTTYTCVCGDTYTADSVEATGHNHEAVVTAPTCEEAGYTTYTCVCGDTYTADPVEAIGHDWDDATCSAPKTCSVCGETEGESLGHAFVCGTCACGQKLSVETTTSMNIYANKGTTGTNTISWTSNGITFTNTKGSTAIRTSDSDHYRVYANSNVTISGSNITKIVITCQSGYVPSLGTIENATVTTNGTVVTITFKEATDSITFKASAQWRLTKIAVTCVTNYTMSDKDTATHEYTTVVTDPTCTTEGYTTYTCKCGSHTDDEVAALGHSYDDGVVTAPTCVDQGYTTYTCATCGDKKVNSYVDATENHTYVNGECSVCGQEEGHVCDYTAVVTDPTCVAAGFTTYTCECGDSYTADETEATGVHTYENGKCSVCNAADPDAAPIVVLELTKADFNTTSYAANNNTKTKNGYSYTSYQVMQQSSTMQWQKSKGYITIAANAFVKLELKSTAGTYTVTVGGKTVTGTTTNGVTTYNLSGLTGEIKISVGSATGKVDYIKFYA